MTWGLERTLDYLSDHGLTVVLKDGVPALRTAPTMTRAEFERAAAVVRPHLAANRVGVLAHFAALTEPDGCLPEHDPAPGTKRFNDLPGPARRAVVLRLAGAWKGATRGGIIGWHCRYTRLTGWLRYPVDLVPDTATHVMVWGYHPFLMRPAYVWQAELPYSETPANWHEPAGFEWPDSWRPGPGLKRHAPQGDEAAERRKEWFRRNWQEPTTWKADDPDD